MFYIPLIIWIYQLASIEQAWLWFDRIFQITTELGTGCFFLFTMLPLNLTLSLSGILE